MSTELHQGSLPRRVSKWCDCYVGQVERVSADFDVGGLADAGRVCAPKPADETA
jgi:hypothetical protein